MYVQLNRCNIQITWFINIVTFSQNIVIFRTINHQLIFLHLETSLLIYKELDLFFLSDITPQKHYQFVVGYPVLCSEAEFCSFLNGQNRETSLSPYYSINCSFCSPWISAGQIIILFKSLQCYLNLNVNLPSLPHCYV